MTAGHRIAGRLIGFTILAALIALIGVLPLSPELTRAQGGGATATPAPGLQVSIAANPVNPPVNKPTTLTAAIANRPSEDAPAYNWEIDFGGSWFSFGGGSTFRYGSGSAETLRFRLTISYRHRRVRHLGADRCHLGRACIGAYIHTYSHSNTYAYIGTYTGAYVRTHAYIGAYAHTYACIGAYTHTYSYVRTYA